MLAVPTRPLAIGVPAVGMQALSQGMAWHEPCYCKLCQVHVVDIIGVVIVFTMGWGCPLSGLRATEHGQQITVSVYLDTLAIDFKCITRQNSISLHFGMHFAL
jgi:hypothetical protein